MISKILRELAKLPGLAALWRRVPLGDVELRTRFGIWRRPHYAYGIYHSALQAKALDLPGVSALELGVAGGDGLTAMEQHAREISRFLGIAIDVYGFDSGSGMPAALDYRDIPYVWGEGFYSMDERALRSRLSSAALVIGDVGETLPAAASEFRFPIGFIAFDLDYYSSTLRAFKVFDSPPESRLPRTYCYFDDIVYPERAMDCDWIGELCAIREFNDARDRQKIAPIHRLRDTRVLQEPWGDQIYAHHDFDHPLYCVNVTRKAAGSRELPLTAR